MKHNHGHIRTSHGGNLPVPDDLVELVRQEHRDEEAIAKRVASAVQEVVDEQLACGLDVINDGEYVKYSQGAYAGYIHNRVTGWVLPEEPREPKRGGPGARDKEDFPGFYESGLWLSGSGGPIRPGFFTPGKKPGKLRPRVCVGPVKYVGQEAIAGDIDALKKALKGKEGGEDGPEGFIAALGPLSLGAGAINEYYPSEEEYMMAVAEVVREEYKAITDAGLIVQVDEPEFFTTWQFYPGWDVPRLRKYLEFAVEVINHSLEGIPEEQVRFHSCWGSGHRPHTNDIELKHIVDLYIKVNAQTYAFEAGNVRHAHEWRVWEDVKLPEGKILMPGVVSHATDLVEHPELVAERLVNYASIVGRENVQGGTDCGIGSRVGHAEIAWAKLRSLAEGARIASKRLWR